MKQPLSISRYGAYKNSGAPWLGDIPDHWGSVRIKNVISKITSGVTPRGGAESYVDAGIPFLRSQNVHNDGLRLDDVSFISPSTHQEMMNSQVKPGDIVFNITGASIARTCIVPESIKTANISQHVALLKLTKSNETKFISYYLQSPFVKDYVYLTQSGASKEAFNHGQMKCIPVALPPRAEQAAIAAYLDTQTAQIDRKVELLGQKAAQYVKLKQSLINETVTRGLDKNVAMKGSGVEWLGEVPAHWKVKRVADIAVQNKVKNCGVEETNLLSLSYGRIIRKDFNTSFGLLPESFETYQVVTAGTIILRLTDLQNDKKSLRVGLVREQGIITSAYLGLRFQRSIDSTFAYYLLHVYDLCKVFYWFGGGLRSTMRFDDIKVIPFIRPPYSEQQAIAAYLDSKTAHIDRIVATINTQIDKLRELRKALINDIVTGKICIVEQAGKNFTHAESRRTRRDKP